MKLFSIPHSPYAARVRAQIYLRQLPVDIVIPPGGIGSDEFKQSAHSGKVPALDTGSGVIVESLAIINFLEARFAEGTLLPADDVARAQQQSLFLACDNYLATMLFPLFKRLQQGMNKDGVADDLAALHLALQSIEEFWRAAQIPAQTTLADCVFAPVLFYINTLAPMFGEPDPFGATPLLAARWQQMQKDAAISKVLDEMSAGLKAMMGG